MHRCVSDISSNVHTGVRLQGVPPALWFLSAYQAYQHRGVPKSLMAKPLPDIIAAIEGASSSAVATPNLLVLQIMCTLCPKTCTESLEL